MRNKDKLKIIIFVLGILFALSLTSNYNFINDQGKNEGFKENRNGHNLKRLKESGYWSTNFIHVDGNWSHTVSNYSWCSGDGSWNNPYIIENVTIDAFTSPTGNGIFIENSKADFFIIKNCMIQNAIMVMGYGIILKNTDNGTLVNNTCSFNGGGIQLNNNCNNNTISGNNVENHPSHGIYLVQNNDNNTILRNTVYISGGSGIYLLNGCDNNSISGNTVYTNSYGIDLDNGCNGNNISGNTAYDNTDSGIDLDDACDDNNIWENTVYESGNSGIDLDNGCNGNIISRNILYDNGVGIYLANTCQLNTVSGNYADENNVYGIYLLNGCDNNSISGNIANYNDYGIGLSNSDNNTISGNIIFFNNIIGIFIDDTCDENLIYLNYIIINFATPATPAMDTGNNQWDDGYAGNYWGDYSGTDFFPKDGIGDVPYIVYGSVYDMKPLMYSNFEDTDGDGLDNLEEYTLGDDGYRTNPVDPDSDDDSFNDGDEAACKTNPLDPLWYPMPNLIVSHFFAFFLSNETSFMLDFSIMNNGIWKAQGVIIIVRCEELGLTLFNNTYSPLTLDVDETEYIAVSYPPIGETGSFILNVTVDPDNTITETYSSKDGSAQIDAENDNSQTAELTILPETLNLAIISQTFSTNEFNISFFIHDDNDQYIDSATIQIWWNGTDASTDVQNLGNGFYFVSLEPITIKPGEDPILLSIIITADGYEDKQFETYLAVDPETLEKRVEQDGKGFPFLILIIAIFSIAGGIGATLITVVILRKRKPTTEVM